MEVSKNQPILSPAELLAQGRPNLIHPLEPSQRIRCDQVFAKNRFKLQVHFEHLPQARNCANFASIHTVASLIGTDGLKISLGDCNGLYEVEAPRNVDVDERDGNVHFAEPVLTYVWPEFKDVVGLRGRYKVRFEVIWVRRKRDGLPGEMVKVVRHRLDTPAVEMYHEEEDEGRIVRPRR